MEPTLETRGLQDAPVRRQVASQDVEAAASLQRILDRANDLLAGRLLDFGNLFGERTPSNRGRLTSHAASVE